MKPNRFKAFEKCHRVIQSCTTEKQIYVCMRLVINFRQMFPDNSDLFLLLHQEVSDKIKKL